MTTCKHIAFIFLCLLPYLPLHGQEINTWQSAQPSAYGEDISRSLEVDYFEDNGTFFHNWNGILDSFASADTLTNDYIKRELKRTRVQVTNNEYTLNGKRLSLPTMLNEQGIDMFLLTEEGITIYMALNPPVYWNETYGDIMKWIRFYAYKNRERTAKMFARYAKWEQHIAKTFAKYGVPPELGILCLVESQCTYRAVSKVGAGGMWQIMPATGRGYGMKINDTIDERFDPLVATEYAARILANNRKLTGDWTLATAAYNCGVARVNRITDNAKTSHWLRIKDRFPEETRQYVPSVLALYYIWTYRKQLNLN